MMPRALGLHVSPESKLYRSLEPYRPIPLTGMQQIPQGQSLDKLGP